MPHGDLMSLRLVTIENFYLNRRDPLAREMFLQMVDVRAEGYGPDYPPNFLPLEAADYVSRQHLICEEPSSGELKAIVGLRVSDLSVLDFYGLKVPLLHSAEVSDATRHVEALRRLIESHRRFGRPLWNNSYFTIRKHLRTAKSREGMREFLKTLKEFMMAVNNFELLQRPSGGMVTGAVPRFKTLEPYLQLGCERIEFEGEALGSFTNKGAAGEPTIPLYMQKVTAWGTALYEKYSDQIANRIVIVAPGEKEEALRRVA